MFVAVIIDGSNYHFEQDVRVERLPGIGERIILPGETHPVVCSVREISHAVRRTDAGDYAMVTIIYGQRVSEETEMPAILDYYNRKINV